MREPPVMSRRGLVRAAGAAIGATAAGISVPALASPAVHADARLLDLIRRHAEVDAAFYRFEAEETRAHGIAVAAYPAMPDALRWHGNDVLRDMGATATGRERRPNDRLRVFYTLDDVDRLREAGPATRWAAVGADHPEPLPREPDPAAEARRLEIITASDAWHAERDAIDASSGWNAVSQALCDLGDDLEGIEREILATVPTTSAGLIAKARWAVLPTLSDITAGLWARRVVADLVAMAEHDAPGGAT